jgi:hypothetical protein
MGGGAPRPGSWNPYISRCRFDGRAVRGVKRRTNAVALFGGSRWPGPAWRWACGVGGYGPGCPAFICGLTGRLLGGPSEVQAVTRARADPADALNPERFQRGLGVSFDEVVAQAHAYAADGR